MHFHAPTIGHGIEFHADSVRFLQQLFGLIQITTEVIDEGFDIVLTNVVRFAE